MSNLVIAATVTRTLLPGSLAPLDFNDHTAYEVVSAGPGGRHWVFDWASAPAVHGEQPVSARMGNQTAPLAIRVKATSKSTFDTRCKALVAAFSQLRYTVSFTIDSGTADAWKCFAADIGPASDGGGDGAWDKFGLIAKYRQVYALQVPRHPIPVTGVM
jgi:hypothetical protein